MKTLAFTRGFTNKPASIQFTASRAPKNLVTALMLAFTLPLVVQAKTIVVPSGSIVTIQDGVNAAAPGDTILVKPGTYAGGVYVDKANVTLKADGATGSVKIAGLVFAGISIVSDGVTVQGFDISGASIGIIAGGKGGHIFGNSVHDAFDVLGIGILVETPASSVRVDHNDVYNNYFSGIAVELSSDVRVDHNTAEHNGRGIFVLHDCSGVQVDHNTATDNSVGFQLDFAGQLSSCGNTFEHNSAHGNIIDLSSADDASAPCNTYKDNDADSALPSLSFWDVR